MSLEIVLDQVRDAIYHPGSTVSGTIQLQAQKEQDVEVLTVSFAGRCKAAVRRTNGNGNSTTYHSKGYYFYQTLVLHDKRYKLRADTYTWPFSFQFPAFAEPVVVTSLNDQGDSFDVDHPFRGSNVGNLHPLPGTFVRSGMVDQKVEYFVQAILTPCRDSFKRNISAERNLYFRPLRSRTSQPQDSVRREDWSVRTLNLLPEENEHRHSFKRKMKGVFSSSSLPQVNLRVEMKAPRTVDAATGSKLPIVVTVSRLPDVLPVGGSYSGATVPVTAVLLRHVEVNIRSVTDVRAGHRFGSMHTRTTGDKFFIYNLDDQAIPINVHDGSTTGYEKQTAGAPPRDFLINLPVPGNTELCPDFSTYNIALHHSLQVKLKLECAGQTLKTGILLSKFKVLAQAADDDDNLAPANGNAMSARGNQDMVGGLSEQIPPPQYVGQDHQPLADSAANYPKQQPYTPEYAQQPLEAGEPCTAAYAQHQSDYQSQQQPYTPEYVRQPVEANDTCQPQQQPYIPEYAQQRPDDGYQHQQSRSGSSEPLPTYGKY